ncbi:MAG: DotI/IcmL/TraM family protein [Alphaproteobacteria bacterium]
MRVNCLLFVIVLLSFGGYSTNANAGWLDFLFPAIEDTGPSPSETLRAPFSDPDAVILDMDSIDNPQNSTPLDQKHRTNTVMIGWLQLVLPSLISYKSDGYDQQYLEKVELFSKNGTDDYVSFLHSRNYITTLKTGRYDITGFIQDYPIVVNEGVIDGRYQWVFQTAVMVTYLDAGLDDYGKSEGEQISQEYVVTFHLGRFEGIKNEHGVLIDSWDVKPKN